MQKKSKLMIILIIFIALFLVVYFNPIQNLTNTNTITLSSVTFELPDEYTKNISNNETLTITDGSHNIYFKEYDGANITDYVHSYENYKLESGLTSNITNFTIDGVLIYKLTVLNENGTTLYWFTKGDKTYSIYTWTYNPKIDTTVVNLISSTH